MLKGANCMRKIQYIPLLMLLASFLYCGSLQVLAQPKTARQFTDTELKLLVQKHIKTPVRSFLKPDGTTWLQRDFTAYLHAVQHFGPDLLPTEAEDGHRHHDGQLNTFLSRPHPSVAAMALYFARAAQEFGVPVGLLKSYGQLQSNWAQVSESMYGSWGIMGVVENEKVQQISQAAELLQVTPEQIKQDAATNIRAAAALLNHFFKQQTGGTTADKWYAAVCRLTGIPEADLQQSLANRVYAVWEQGSKSVSIWGEIIDLKPATADAGFVPLEKITDRPLQTELQGNGTPDYAAAVYNLTTCNFNSRPSGAAIRYYFVHYIAVGTYEGTISWFKNCSAQASAHYVVRNSDGLVTQMVDEEDRAWSQGVTEYNDQGIGVEHEVLATNLAMWESQPMLASAGRLAADVCNRNNIPKQRRANNGESGIYGHSDVRATDCPNMTPQRWTSFLANVQNTTPSVGTPALYSIMATPGSATVTATWKGNTEPGLLGYRLYYATNDDLATWQLAADEQTLTAGTTSITLQPAQFVVPPAAPVYHFRLTAVVANGSMPPVESAPGDVYSRSWMTTGTRLLIVDGFDRSSGSYKSNTHAFAAAYQKALRERGTLVISTTANERVEDGSVQLGNFDIVLWFLGDESSANVVFSAAEKAAIRAYLQGGGKLMVSGSEVAYNLGRNAAAAFDSEFMTEYLKAAYVNDGSVSYTPATGIAGTAFEGLNLPFGSVYPEDFPDAIAPTGGSVAVLDYAVAPNKAAVVYKGNFKGGSTPGALVYAAFPLETLQPVPLSQFMEKALAYLDVPTLAAPPVAVADTFVVAANRVKRLHVLANDNPNGGTLNAASVVVATLPLQGTVQVAADGTLLYTPLQGFTGNDVLQYKVAGAGGVYSANVQVLLQVTTTTNCDPNRPETDDAHPVRELRGAWVTSVFNLDWPTNRLASPAQQQAELLTILDTLKHTGFNTVFLQVRTGSDALYASPYEPWSYYLTGAEGQAPSPLWDPLAFAVEAAHERGLQLHAWVNPYRARTGSFTLAANHLINQHPDWILTIGTNLILNPGLPQVRQHLATVMADIATRYAVDGIHFDDYFYPSGVTAGMQDAATFAAHNPTGIGTIEDWRRDNVNRMIALVYDTLQYINSQTNRNIIFGVSPFGIWKAGVPVGISGQASYSALYCDPIAWLQAGKVDYLAPQLYWRITGAQDYDRLSKWWHDTARHYNRPVYTGHAWYKMTDANNWAATEIENQLMMNRRWNRPNIKGGIGYRTGQLMADSKGLQTALKQGLYRYEAYAPPYAFKENICPLPPQQVRVQGNMLRWDAPEAAPDGDTAIRYVVYTYPDSGTAAPMPYDGRRVLGITGKKYLVLAGSSFAQPPFARYMVTALDKNNNESQPAISALPDVVLCAGGQAKLPALVQGSAYQWQMLSAEDGWQALTNGAGFSGVQTDTLQLTGATAQLYGAQLRCVANGNTPGPVYTLRIGSVWTAGQNNLWSNAANWNCSAVPDAQTDAVIHGGVTPYPVVDTENAAARRVLLLGGAQVQVLPGMKLQITNQ